MISLNELAGLIAATESLPEEHFASLLRRVRLLATKDLVPVERETTGRKEGRLSLEGACRAWLASTLIDVGFDADSLRGVNTFFNARHSASELSAFESATQAIRSGLSVDLTINLFLNTRTGHKHIGVSIPATKPLSPIVDAALAHVVSLACISVPLNSIYAAVFEYFEREAQN